MADQDFNIKIVTTADTAGLRQTREEMEKLRQDAGAKALFARIPPGGIIPPKEAEDAGSKLGEHIGRGFERMAIHAIGIGAVLESIDAIKQMAAEINKITDALDKQGELLVQNSRHMIEQSKFAHTDADILKIAEEAMKNIVEQHKVVEELQKKEISHAEALADAWANPYGTGGPNQARLDAERASAMDNEASARRVGIQAIATAETTKARLATESYSKAVEELNKKLADEQTKRNAAFLSGDVQGYVEAGNAAAKYTEELKNVKAAHDKLTDKTQKYIETADPQVKAILANEKAMFEARAAGRGTDAAMFEKSAQALRAGARPDQLAEVNKIYSGKEVIDALKQIDVNQRQLIDLWR